MSKRIYVANDGRNSFSWGETTGTPEKQPVANVAQATQSLRKLGISQSGIQQVINGGFVTSGSDRAKIARVLASIDMGGVM